MLADAGDDILQRAPLGLVIVDIVGGDERQSGLLRDIGEAREAARIVAAIEMICREIGAAAETGRNLFSK